MNKKASKQILRMKEMVGINCNKNTGEQNESIKKS